MEQTSIMYGRQMSELGARCYVKSKDPDGIGRLTGICTLCHLEADLGFGMMSVPDSRQWVDDHVALHKAKGEAEAFTGLDNG